MGSSEFDCNKLSYLIELIYKSVENPELWPKLLSKLNKIATQNIDTHDTSTEVLPEYNSSHIEQLRPHFLRALELSQKLFNTKKERDSLSGILERLPIGVILVNHEQRPVGLNAHARKFLQHSNILTVKNGKLITTSDNSSSKKLSRMIAAATMPKLPYSTDSDEISESILLKTEHLPPCSIFVTPHSCSNSLSSESIAALYISSSDIRQSISVDKLTATYSLTLAEARLLQQLVNQSHSLTEAATALGLSKHTVRTQMKAVLEKTECHSQTEVVKKILTGPSAMVGSENIVAPTQNVQPLVFSKNGCEQVYKVISTFDKRLLEYTEFGDPDGTPLIYLHGILHSRKQFHPFSSYAEEHGIRIIAPERPGFGQSSRLSNGSLCSYASDIRQLSDMLGLEEFFLFGDGHGAPAALACANQMPERTIRAAVTGCMPDPAFESMETLLPFDRRLLTMAKSTPQSILYPFSKIILKSLTKDNNYFNLMADEFGSADKLIISTPEHREIFQESMENISQENIDGFIDDYYARLIPWDFKLQQTQPKIHFWHGADDRYSSIKSLNKITACLPNCQTHILKEHGRYLFFSHIDEILATLLQEDNLEQA